MSEHTRIKGKCIYDHLPYNEDYGFSYCKRCKRFAESLEVCFNEGICSGWMQVNCGHCGKAIWVVEFEHKQRKFISDDKKCSVCKKKTNHYDCYASGGRLSSKKLNYWCSKKCHDKWDKQDAKRWEKKKLKAK